MMKANLPRRFLTLRDKDRTGGTHRRNRSSEGGHRTRPFAPDGFFAIFRPEAAKQAARAREEEEKESLKIDEITKWIEEEKLTGITPEQIRYALSSKYSGGDVAKSQELLKFQHDACEGTLLPYNPNMQMLGAENRGAVTCYLDALLFAMFAKIEAFECMLLRDHTNESTRNLAALLRLWVNMLRSGKLICTDMTEHIQNALAECGWQDARRLEQQDTSEAFGFITETLQLPLLTLQVDLFHQGKGDEDDHKVVFERLLNLAIPADPEDRGIKLEDCLEEYFNTRVDVLRDSLDEKKGGDRAPESPIRVLSPKSTIRVVTDLDDHDEAHDEAQDKVENLTPLQRRWTSVDSPGSSSSTPTRETRPESRPSARTRSTSIIQRVVLDVDGKPTDADASTPTMMQKVRRQGSTVVKAVTIPAWQFFRLIPWHSAGKGEPLNDIDVAKHLNKKPVVGICLKRYMMTEAGLPKRQNTFIDIPDSLRLPHFMIVDDATKAEESNGLSAEYKLVLQSIVCHRGDSLHSGHYVSFARVAPKLLTDNRRHEKDPPPDYEEPQWVKFDDLLEERVTYVDDIKQSLKEEMPYLLFYQILPMVDVAAPSLSGTETEPPSYNDSTVNVVHTTTASSYSPTTTTTDSERPGMSRQTSGYFDSTTLTHSTGPSVRFSSELERPSRLSLDAADASTATAGPLPPATPETFLKVAPSRRSSVPHGDAVPAGALTPSPAVTPSEETGSTAQRLSRAAALFSKSKDKDKEKDKDKDKSRPVSQAGENRVSITIQRLGGLMRPSKEPLREPADPYEDVTGSAQHIEQPPLGLPVEGAVPEKDANNKEKEKDSKKDRAGKSKGHKADKEHKDKDKEKWKHHRKSSSGGGGAPGAGNRLDNNGEPERECILM